MSNISADRHRRTPVSLLLYGPLPRGEVPGSEEGVSKGGTCPCLIPLIMSLVVRSMLYRDGKKQERMAELLLVLLKRQAQLTYNG